MLQVRQDEHHGLATLHDKRLALVDLGRHLGLFDTKHNLATRWNAL
jgi:hypothetical protein